MHKAGGQKSRQRVVMARGSASLFVPHPLVPCAFPHRWEQRDFSPEGLLRKRARSVLSRSYATRGLWLEIPLPRERARSFLPFLYVTRESWREIPSSQDLLSLLSVSLSRQRAALPFPQG